MNNSNSRRRFMEWFVKGFLGVNLMGPLATRLCAASRQPGENRGTAQSVIFLFLRGGLSHIDTFDPKPGRPEMAGVKAIDTSADGVQISEWFSKLARRMHHVSLVRSVTSTQGVHARGNYLAHTSYFQTPTISHPALGAWVMKQVGSVNRLIPGNVLICGNSQHPGSGYMESHLAPLPIGDPAAGLQNSRIPKNVSDAEFARRTRLARSLGQSFRRRTPHRKVDGYRKIHEEAIQLMNSEDLKAFDISLESEKTRSAYGEARFGQGCLLARRLVEHGVRFVEVEETQNWDTHIDHLFEMRRMTPSVDQALAALLDDLHQRGLLESTLVVMATEFGRTPQFSGAANGRGHHPAAFTWWLAGGGIKSGFVFGSTDARAERVKDNPVRMPNLNATIAQALGLDLEMIAHSPSGRPFTVANKGRPVSDLFA